MYHVKKDTKSQNSAHAICRGFAKCLQKQQMNLKNVRISDIIKASQVGRATFYRLFDAKEDVLAYQCDLVIQKIHQIPRVDSTTQFLFKCLNVCFKNSLLFEAIFHSHREQILYHTLMNKLYLLKDRFQILKKCSASQLDFVFSDLSYLLISTLKIWIQHHKKETAQELMGNLVTELKIIHQLLNDK